MHQGDAERMSCMKHKAYFAFLTALILCAGLVSGCSKADSGDSSTRTAAGSSAGDSADTVQAEQLGALQAASLLPLTLEPEDLDDSWEDSAVQITLSGDTVQVSGEGVTIEDNTVTITQAGTYVVSGTLDGVLRVDAPKDTVHLVLNGVTLSNDATAPVQVTDAKKVVLTLAEGSSNQLTDGKTYTSFTDAENTEPNAALFAKSDLTINGKGSLQVTGQYANGIQSKDTLCIVSGSIRVTAANHGLKGKDAVLIAGGILTVDAQGDGIQASNDTDSQKGYVVISDGQITVDAGQDGIQAETCLAVTGGDLTINAGEGSANAAPHQESMPGSGQQTQTDTGTETVSTKGMKASTELYIAGGTISIDAQDDGLHSNGSMTLAGGEITIRTGDDGAHADSSLTVQDGDIRIEESYEGLEAVELYIQGGTVHITASDDGLNAAGSLSADTSVQGETTGYVQTAFGGFGGMGMVDQDAKLEISGGYVYINAGGDGIDSNNGVTISGGTVLVCGPTDSANGALDSETGIVVNGGFLLAVGSSGMAEIPEDTSGQYAAAIGTGTQQAGTLLTITDSDGQVLCAFAPEKQYQHVVFSAPALQEGETYTVTLGGSCSGTETDGLYTGGDCTGGTELTSFTVSDRITTAGSNAGGMNPQGGGFPGGQDGMTPPDRQEQGTRPSFDGQEPPEDMTPPDGFDPTQEGKTPPGGFGGFDPKANTGNA